MLLSDFIQIQGSAHLLLYFVLWPPLMFMILASLSFNDEDVCTKISTAISTLVILHKTKPNKLFMELSLISVPLTTLILTFTLTSLHTAQCAHLRWVKEGAKVSNWNCDADLLFTFIMLTQCGR